MKFYDRQKELEQVGSFVYIVKKKGSRILVLTGRRRIGKTRLALESLKDFNHLYFFTKKKRMNELLNEWSDEIKSKLGNVFYGKLQTLDEMLDFLFEYSKKNPMAVVFDEVQNLLFSDPSAFGAFQKTYDMHREKSHLLLVFLGSSFSLMNKIFRDNKEPLFGRASDIMTLSYLPLEAQKQILKDHGLFSGENLLHLFSIFDGVPKYIEELVDLEKKNFKESFNILLTQREFLWDEGENLLKEEFGKEYSSYYSILSAIAKGRRKLNDIVQFTGIQEAGSYLKNLEEIYKFIERKLPLTSRNIKERNSRYYIKDNFLHFWFRFIEAKKGLKEIKKEETAVEEIWTQLPEYEGRKLEDMVIRKMIEVNPLRINFTKAGKYWDRKGSIEIDAVFLDENEKKAYLFEVKINKRKLNRQKLEALKHKAAAINEFRDYEILTAAAYIEDSGLKIEMP